MGNVNADPAAIEALCDGDGGAAPAEGIEDKVAFIRTGLDDAFEKGLRLLGLIPEPFGCEIMHGADVRPYILQRNTGLLIGVALGEEHVVVLAAIERRVEVDQVDRLVLDVLAQDRDVIAVIKTI